MRTFQTIAYALACTVGIFGLLALFVFLPTLLAQRF